MGFRSLLLKCLPALLLATQSFAMSTLNLPGVTRSLSPSEENFMSEVIVNHVLPYDRKAADQLLYRLRSRNIKVWLKSGYGFTNPITGVIGIAEAFFTPRGTFQFLRGEKYKVDESLKRRGIDPSRLSRSEAIKKRYLLEPIIPYVKPGSEIQATAQEMLLASMLIHENEHCRQGRRRLIVGDIAVMAASNISDGITRLNPAELGAYVEQSEFAESVRAASLRGRGRIDRIPHPRDRLIARAAYAITEIVGESLRRYSQ